MLQGWICNLLPPVACCHVFRVQKSFAPRGRRTPSTFRVTHPGDWPPSFFISVWLPQARREFFLSVIILLLLKAGKSHPGMEAGSCF